jgi:hypothetical protein
MSSEQPRPHVAICLAGLSRTLCNTYANIYEHMVLPIHNVTDVFVFTQSTPCEKDMRELLNPVRYRLRTRTTHFNKHNYWYPCWNDIVSHENAEGKSYEWVMKIRTDIVYSKPLHPMPWKSYTYPVVFAEACGSGSYPKETTKAGGMCHKRIGSKWGCSKDTWNLMNRMAAVTYFTSRNTENCYRNTAECLLGCSLFFNNVTVIKQPISRRIVRSKPFQSGRRSRSQLG